MISTIPSNWKYNSNLEMLYLFYQASEEMLSDCTPDTYSLPLHNTYSLVSEINDIYFMLKKHDIIDEYYNQYIPVIIDEFMSALEDDYLIKKKINKRLDSIKTGFTEAKSNHKLLERWLNLFFQCCFPTQYLEMYKLEIINLISTKNKQALLYCIKNYYISLLNFGYTREFLYLSLKRFFNNTKNTIEDSSLISNFLSEFDLSQKEYEFLVLMDSNTLEYLDTINNQLKEIKKLDIIDVDKKFYKKIIDDNIRAMIRKRDHLINQDRQNQKISIVEYKCKNFDYFRSIEELRNYLNFLSSFCQYFKHYYPTRQIFMILLKTDEDRFKEIKVPNILSKRPYIEQEIMDRRLKNLLGNAMMSTEAITSFTKALQMHSEALESRKTTMILRSFWTALESLFSNSSDRKIHSNFENDILNIIQKTYILKILRSIFSQLTHAIGIKEMTKLGIEKFNEFVQYFSVNPENSNEMKEIYTLLANNPLLRTRLFNLRKKLSSGKKIQALLKKHQQKIEWQIKRLYRDRNIATHIGDEVPNLNVAVNHIHNYFDFIINYVICKSENGDFVSSIASLAFEAQNDNRIHNELLKCDEQLSINNYMEYLFGPDSNLINYNFS